MCFEDRKRHVFLVSPTSHYLLEKMHKGVVAFCKCASGSNINTIRWNPGLFPCPQTPRRTWNFLLSWPYLLSARPSLKLYTLLQISNCQNTPGSFSPLWDHRCKFPSGSPRKLLFVHETPSCHHLVHEILLANLPPPSQTQSLPYLSRLNYCTYHTAL